MNKAERFGNKNNKKNQLVKFLIVFVLFSVLIHLHFSDWELVLSTTVNNSNLPQTTEPDPQRNIITSQNTGNSNSNGDSDDRVDSTQDQSNNLNLEDSQATVESNTTSEPGLANDQSFSNDRQTFSEEVSLTCGQIIQGKVKLGSNLFCEGDGLIVGENNTVIDMNGFSLKGPGVESNKVGIMIGGQNNITITGNGIISGFQSGVYISGSTNIHVNEINVNNNKVAFYISGAQYSEISNNMVSENTIGVALHSSRDAEVNFNQLNKNRLSGITIIVIIQ